MLVAYCGLNPMGGKCKAGCPVKNVQATLDRLTEVKAHGNCILVFRLRHLDTSHLDGAINCSV